MNLGQFLTAKSPLPSGTVAQHLAAIAASVGTGTGETVFASQFSVQIAQDELIVTRRAKSTAQAEQPAVQPRRAPAKQDKNVAVFSAIESLAVLTAPEEITVLQRTSPIIVTQRLPNETITRKRKAGLVQST